MCVNCRVHLNTHHFNPGHDDIAAAFAEKRFSLCYKPDQFYVSTSSTFPSTLRAESSRGVPAMFLRCSCHCSFPQKFHTHLHAVTFTRISRPVFFNPFLQRLCLNSCITTPEQLRTILLHHRRDELSLHHTTAPRIVRAGIATHHAATPHTHEHSLHHTTAPRIVRAGRFFPNHQPTNAEPFTSHYSSPNSTTSTFFPKPRSHPR